MANPVISTITVFGDGREPIKKLFDAAAVTTEYGCDWDLKEYDTVLLCDTQHGDGITVNRHAITIQCEFRKSPPLVLTQNLSSEFPGLTFEVRGKDVLNLFLQRWRFEAGEGHLLDCVQGAHEGEGEEVVYLLDGQQLPDWVAANNHPAFAD